MRWIVALLLVPMLAACVEEDRQMYRWSGTFAEDRSQLDIEAFVQEASRHGEVAILESFPEQFVITRLDAGGCQFLQPFIETRDYIAQHSGCTPMARQP